MLINQGLSHSTKLNKYKVLLRERAMPAGKALLASPASPRINEQFGLIANPALATIRRITSMSDKKVTIGS